MKILFQIIFTLFISNGFGQVMGKIQTVNGEPIPFANVVLFNTSDSSLITGTTTDEKGIFNINTSKTGNFYIKISSIGFKNFQTKSFTLDTVTQSAMAQDALNGGAFQLPDIVLYDENNALSEVTISVKKDLIQNTPLGKVINIQNSILTKGSNALQVLERLPGVITDRRNNQFSLNGQSGVTVLFNGRKVQLSMEELMNLLESTVADNIEKIELITSPTAQYDADGGAGIINIIFKKGVNEGTKAHFSATVGYGFREKAVTALSISHGFKKANIYAGYSFSHDVGQSGFKGEGTNEGIGSFKSQYAAFSGISRRFQNNHNVNFTTEFRPTTKTSFGSDIIFSFNKAHYLANNDVIWSFTDGDYLDFRALSDGRNTRQNMVSAVFLKHKISEKSQLNIDANYITYINNSPTLINGEYFDKSGNPITPNNTLYTSGNKGESVSKIQASVLKIDYSWALNDKINVEWGLKGSLANNINDSKVERKVNGVWEIDPRSQSLIDGQEKIGAIYSQLKWAINAKSSLHTGLRYEYWQRDINIYKNAFTIGQLYPSVLYMYSFNERANLSLNYNRRISRPAYNDLISNLFYNDPTFVFSGNPLLKPTITDVLKVDLIVKGLNVGLSAQHDLHPILRYQITSNAAKDVGISSPQNLDYQKSLNLYLNYPLQIADWWRFSISSTTSLRKYKISYSLKPAEKTFVFQNFNFNQNITLPKQFEIELLGWYNLPFYEGTNSIKGFGILNLGIAKKLKNDKGTFQLSLPDVLQSFSVHTHISGMTPIAFNINTVSNWRDETAFYRVVKLTYSRSFGKNTINQNKRNSANEEAERLR